MNIFPRIALLLSLMLASSLSWAANHTGSVLETMNSAGYTYAKIKAKQQEFWIAGPTVTLKVGDVVSFSEQMTMPNFTSKTLNRRFDKLMFVAAITQGSAPAAARSASPHAGMSKSSAISSAAKIGNIEKAEGGFTVAELFSKRAELSGQQVTLRGRVVKVSNGIMKSNWIHLQDGSGKAGSNDIIFRAKTATATVGDVVLAKGTLIIDQDFGYGYKYAVMVEDASFEVNK